MYNLRLKLNIASATFRMARMMFGDFLCFAMHKHIETLGGEHYCEHCWRWWQDDYCVSRYVHKEWEKV